MALTQLIGVGIQNIDMRVRNVAHEYLTFESEGLNHVIITREADIILPEHLELHFSDPNRDNLQDVKKLVLRMELEGRIVQQFPLSLLVNLHP